LCCVPERSAEPELYRHILILLGNLHRTPWIGYYVCWEQELLHAMGIGFDLSECAGGGAGELCYLSPKSGRAVSREIGEPYAKKLWLMPHCFLHPDREHVNQDYALALSIIGQFLLQHGPAIKELPEIRQNLAAKWARMS
jgi:DNA repair protein RecO (recombination protein O)